MTIFLEYLIRRDLLSGVFRGPCSIPVERGPARKLIVFHPMESGMILVKQWHLDQVDSTKPLPPHDSVILSRAKVLEGCGIPDGFRPALSCQIPGTPVGGASIPTGPVYRHNFDNVLNPDTQRRRRLVWVWCAFLKAYKEMTKLSIDPYIAPESLYDMSRELMVYRPRLWQYWDTWNKHMIELDSGVAGELFFSASSSASSQ